MSMPHALTALRRRHRLLGAALPGWDAARARPARRSGAAPPTPRQARPRPQLLPPTERRRAPDTVRSRSRSRRAAVRDGRTATPSDAALVFTSTHGDLAITDYMCATLARDAGADLADQVPQFGAQRRGRLLDHRAPAAASRSTALSAFDASFGAGLLEAAIAVAADAASRCCSSPSTSTPRAARRRWRRAAACSAVALVLAPGARSRARWRVRRRRLRGAATQPRGDAGARSPATPRGRVADANAMADALPLLRSAGRAAQLRSAATCTLRASATVASATSAALSGRRHANAHARRTRRRHPRRRARRPDARAAAAAALRRRSTSWCSSGAPSGAAGRAQGRRIVGRDRRALLRRRCSGSSEHLDAARSCASSASASSSREGAQRHRRRHRARREPLPARRRATSSTAASSRTSSASTRARAACASSTARRCAASTLGDDGGAAPTCAIDARRRRRTTSTARWLVDACGRAGLSSASSASPRRTATTPTRSGSASTTRIDVDDWSTIATWQRALRRRRERWLSTNHLVRRRLLGLADPARLGLAFGRHRRRREAASARDDEHVRARRWSGSRAPAAAARATLDDERDLLQDFAVPAPLLVRLQAGLLGAIAGRSPARPACSSIRSIRRAATSSRSRNTYITELIAHDRAGQPLGAVRARLRAALLLVLREHAAALPRPVRDVRRPRGACRSR